jgi:hypothetical protein
MPKRPFAQTLNPEQALSSGLRTNSPAIVKGEDLTALKTIAASLTEQYKPVLPTEMMWIQLLAYSFFRLHRLWNLSAQISERELTSAKLFHTLDYDYLRPVIEQDIQSLQNDITALQGIFKRVLENELPQVAVEHFLIIIADRSPPTVQTLFADSLQILKNAPEDLREAIEAVLSGLREEISKNRATIVEIESIRSRLADLKINTSSNHKDSDRLLNQEMKLIQTIERCQLNLAKTAKQRKAKMV